MAAPSKNGVKNSPGDLAHSDSAFDIVMALEDHIRLALPAWKINPLAGGTMSLPAPW